VNDQIEQIEPADAARALSEISRRREQVIRRTATPRWYWWAIAVLTVASAADVDYTSQRGALYWAGVALTAAGVLAVTGLVFRAARGATLSPDLVAPGTAPRLLAAAAAYNAAALGVTLGTELGLEAARVPYPATIACAAGMAVLVAGGQMWTRYRTALLVRRPGGRG
jgi:hypothetical protein